MGGVVWDRNTEECRKLPEARGKKEIGSTPSLRREPALLVDVNSHH